MWFVCIYAYTFAGHDSLASESRAQSICSARKCPRRPYILHVYILHVLPTRACVHVLNVDHSLLILLLLLHSRALQMDMFYIYFTYILHAYIPVDRYMYIYTSRSYTLHL
jgi:hypothetical protein